MKEATMDMNILRSERMLCPCCMEEHDVKTVLIRDQLTFKNRKVTCDAIYQYCDRADELYMNEQQMRENDIRMKDAYRREEGLLTSSEISTIRCKYGITQNDFSTLLGWGGKTITRYESHQVQDKAHDTILKIIDRDPEWFLSLLIESRDSLPEEAYQKYYKSANQLCGEKQDWYIRRAIEARYAQFRENPLFGGNTELSLERVIDVIRYFATSAKITNLYEVKLMKLMWYADTLSYIRRGTAITGLVYQAFPRSVVPVAHSEILELKNVPCEKVEIGETYTYHFSSDGEKIYPSLSKDDTAVLDVVIDKLGKKTKDEIVSIMQKEQAYLETKPKEIILFRYSNQLQI